MEQVSTFASLLTHRMKAPITSFVEWVTEIIALLGVCVSDPVRLWVFIRDESLQEADGNPNLFTVTYVRIENNICNLLIERVS